MTAHANIFLFFRSVALSRCCKNCNIFPENTKFLQIIHNIRKFYKSLFMVLNTLKN